MTRKFLGILLWLGLVILHPAAALAHGNSPLQAELTVDPQTPVAGSPATVQVNIYDTTQRNKPVTGAALTLNLAGGRSSERILLTETKPGLYSGTFTLPAGRYDLRLTVEQNGQREFAPGGLIVSAPGSTASEMSAQTLFFMPAGPLDPLVWLDTAGGIAILPLVVAAALVFAFRRPATGEPRTSGKVPTGLLAAAALGALAQAAGLYWDIAFHINEGRESFWSPPHFLIYSGITFTLLSTAAGTWLVVRKAPRWWQALKAEPALLVAMTAMVLQLASAPVDELWHALFGIDVSVWSPPHLLLLAGAVVALLGLAAVPVRSEDVVATALRVVALAGTVALANIFLAEFEFPIPGWHTSQGRPAGLYPTFLAVFGALGFTLSARLMPRPGGATAAALLYWAFRAVMPLWLPALGQPALPVLAPLAILPAALAVDLAQTYRKSPGPTALADTFGGALFAGVLFALYLPLNALLASEPVGSDQLLYWLPVAVVTAGAAGSLGGALGPGPAIAGARTQPRG